ncbi:MAG TPA: hypothetical protein VF613_25760 [Longimicrobium sp.]|jgi:lipid-A-disaccharide synthase-like uncharacterized protein
MPQNRRASDRRWVKLVGWAACLALAGSLTYTFISSLSSESKPIDPIFFGMQVAASLLFLIYSIRLRSRIFVVANSVAVLNGLGTLIVALTR